MCIGRGYIYNRETMSRNESMLFLTIDRADQSTSIKTRMQVCSMEKKQTKINKYKL